MAEEFNNMTPPEPPKDENGNPIAPPEAEEAAGEAAETAEV